jgi:hypothetical protein
MDIMYAIEWSQTGLAFLSYVHTALLVGWGFGPLVNGFSNGIFHAVPLAYEIFALKILSDTIGFGLNLINGKWVAEAILKIRMIKFSVFVFVVAIALNITHFVFTIIEVVDTVGDLHGFLIFFSVLLGTLTLLECVYVYYLLKYKRYLLLLKKN